MSTTSLILMALYLLALVASVLVWRWGGPYARWGRLAFAGLATAGVGLLIGSWWGDEEQSASPRDTPTDPRAPPSPPVRSVEIEALDHLADGTDRRLEELDDEIEQAQTLDDVDRSARDVARGSRFAERLGGAVSEE